jgi:hypothetical protein
MLHRTFSVVALAATIAVIPAGAGSAETDEVWSCGWTWAASPTGKDTVYMTRYQVKGSVLLSGSPPDPAQAKYQILDNNEYGLVASHGFSDERDGKSNVVVSTVQIDKKTGRSPFEHDSGIRSARRNERNMYEFRIDSVDLFRD